jgi:hypothetical protein
MDMKIAYFEDVEAEQLVLDLKRACRRSRMYQRSLAKRAACCEINR